MEKTTTEFASELSLNIKTLQNKISYESKKEMRLVLSETGKDIFLIVNKII